jgi:DNA-binding phage protein
VKRTSLDDQLRVELQNPEFGAQFESELRLIREIDRLVTELDASRELNGVSKRELADQIGVTDSQVRRLFSSPDKNPTLKSFLSMAAALGLEVQLVSSSESARISA